MNTFSERVLEVMSSARMEAQHLLQNYIGTEHILLGLLHQEGSAALDVMKEFGVESNTLRHEVLFLIDRPNRVLLRNIGLTLGARRTMELAVIENQRLGKRTIGTIPILLGLVLEGAGIAAGILENHGMTPEKLRLAVRQVLSRRDDS